MDITKFMEQFSSDFFTGVPDSLLRPLCDYIIEEKGISSNHVIAANEGNCAALAAGYYLATSRIPIVYLQNSGIGNIINPVVSLMNEEIYGIPCIFFVGWRGEPEIKDEPQHSYQGKITIKLLEDVGITTFVLGGDTTEENLGNFLRNSKQILKQGKQVAFVFRKGTLEGGAYKNNYGNAYQLLREEAISCITEISKGDIIVSSTGKISRELFEIRERERQPHCYDFLTVGSMGHSSSIALGIAMEKVNTRIWCLEGDGSFLMHMGAAGVIGNIKPNNFIHVVFNNESHESVGGMPTVAATINLCGVALECGYHNVYCIDTIQKLKDVLKKVVVENILTFIEIKVRIGSREDLGRPTIVVGDNKKAFMEYLQNLN